ncbi:putative protein S-acyltransferase 16 [Dichanthelium oligosanthes]|uniref:Palmitoyltransferase n=1 Tax=Dichanthelium oligosanthes TaxID=888268 RepID=A0A1E5ULL9_9POAL|nr:putative protein S-acyltransferase 16 [Dichanthelium oligosanthes]
MAGRPGYLTLPIFSVLAAIGYVYYTAVFLAVPRWLGLATAAGVANAAAFTALAAACLTTYAVAVLRDPGRVPPGFVPDVEDAQSTVHEIKRKILIIGSVLHSVPKDEQSGSDSSRTSIVSTLEMSIEIICGVILCPVALALAVLLGRHIYLILQNKTTIEYHEGVRAMWLAEKGGDLYHHPYDLGVYENLISVLGPNIFCWLCPVSNTVGNGLQYRTSYDIPISTQPM